MDRELHDLAEVSVVIPAYNAAATIGRALTSVCNQSKPPAEVIVVDDGSTDGTYEAACAKKGAMGGIQLKVLRQPNLGAGAARNRALKEAGYPIVAFLDADDEWLDRKLEVSLARLTAGDFDLVAHNGWVEQNGREEALDIAERFRAAAGDLLHELYRRGFISTSSVVARRASIELAGGFDEGLESGQDFDLWLKMLLRLGAKFEVFDQRLTRYHISPGGITSRTDRRLANTLDIAIRHAPRLRALTGRWLASLWFRIAALHAEAAAAHWRRGRRAAALRTGSAFPWVLARLTACAYQAMPRRENSRRRAGHIAAGAWIALVIGAYLYQFHGIIGSVLRALGAVG